MTSLATARPLHDASWILVGALLGSAICFLATGGQSGLDPAGAASFASLAVSALLMTTLHDHAQPLPAPRPC